jgi:hypothetical protein
VTDQNRPLVAAAIRETHELHVFFVTWFTAAATQTQSAFARLDAALDAGFSMVAPSGARIAREDVVRQLWGAHGSRVLDAPPFRIWIENEAAIFVTDAVVVLAYDECQQISAKTTRRRSTAVFRADPAGPNGLRWTALHETWVEAP